MPKDIIKPYNFENMYMIDAQRFLDKEKMRFSISRGDVFDVLIVGEFDYYFDSDDGLFYKCRPR